MQQGGVQDAGMKTTTTEAPPLLADSTQPTEKPLRYKPKPKGSWMKLFGRAKHDDLSPEAYRLGAEWRERMNKEGRC